MIGLQPWLRWQECSRQGRAQVSVGLLTGRWHDGALVGIKPEQAYFGAAHGAAMTQNDLKNGTSICLFGMGPQKPAELVILRFHQKSAS